MKTNTTRSQGVRFNSKQMAEMLLFMEREKGWKIESLGGFMRDLFEAFHNILSQEQGFEQLTGSAEAEEMLQKFQTGRVNKRNLSLTVNQERFGQNDSYYRPNTKNPRKNEKRRKQTTYNDASLQGEIGNMPEGMREKFDRLSNLGQEAIIASIENGFSWERIDEMMSNLNDAERERNEEESYKRKQTIEQAKEDARDTGILVNDIEAYRKRIDHEQEQQLKDIMRQPPSDLVSENESR